MLGLKYPVFQSPMAGISTVKLASAITNAGGLGAIPLAPYDVRSAKGIEQVKAALDSFKSLVEQPDLSRNVNVNFFCHDRSIQTKVPSNNEVSNWKTIFTKAFNQDVSKIEHPISNISFQEVETPKYAESYKQLIDLLVEYNPKIVSFHFGLPSEKTIQTLQDSGISVFVSVTSLAEAKHAISAKVKGLVCQGYEAGGHRGNFLADSENDENLFTYVLTKKVVDEVKKQGLKDKIHVVPAGGIMNSNDVQTYLSIDGVSAVQLGTAFLDTKESASNGFISGHREYPTVMTSLISGKNARCLRTPFIDRVVKEGHALQTKVSAAAAESGTAAEFIPPYGYAYSGYKSAHGKIGNKDFGFYLAGQGFPLLKGNGIEAKLVFEELVQDLK